MPYLKGSSKNHVLNKAHTHTRINQSQPTKPSANQTQHPQLPAAPQRYHQSLKRQPNGISLNVSPLYLIVDMSLNSSLISVGAYLKPISSLQILTMKLYTTTLIIDDPTRGMLTCQAFLSSWLFKPYWLLTSWPKKYK